MYSHKGIWHIRNAFIVNTVNYPTKFEKLALLKHC